MTEHRKRNYILIFLDVILFVNAMTFISVNTVIPYFLNTLKATTFQISLASALVSIGTFVSQPLFSKKALETKEKAKQFVLILLIQRIFFAIFVVTIPIIAGKSYMLMVIAFLICWGIFNFFTGSYTPYYISIFAKIMPEHLRGRVIGYSNAIANVVALGASFLVGVILKTMAFPYNYTLIFGAGVFILLLDALVFVLIKEPVDTHEIKQVSTLEFIKSIPVIFKNNRKFVRMIIGFSFIVISNISLVFYTLYAVRTYNAGAGELALFMVIMIVSNIFGNLVFGFFADRFSYKFVLQLASVCGATAALVVLGIPSIYGVYAAFALSTLCAGGYLVSSNVLIVQNSPQQQLPVYLSINVMITLMVSTIFTLLSGLIINIASFSAVFVITGVSGLGAFILFTFIFDRKNKELISE